MILTLHKSLENQQFVHENVVVVFVGVVIVVVVVDDVVDVVVAVVVMGVFLVPSFEQKSVFARM